MNVPEHDYELETELAGAFDGPPDADFDAWRRDFPAAAGWLNPRRIDAITKRRLMMRRVARIAVAAVVLVCVGLGVSYFSSETNGNAAFAEIIRQVNKAKMITWKTTFIHRVTSKDGKTWIETETREEAYKAPGLYRDVARDAKGEIRWVCITDAHHLKEVTLVPRKKKATIKECAFSMRDPRGPFAWVKEKLQGELQWVGKKKMADGREVNVFRTAVNDRANDRDWSYDYWIDVETKELVALHVPGADILDLEKNPPEKKPPDRGKVWTMTAVGYFKHDIDFNAELDPSLFSFEVPERYTHKTESRSQVTEQEMVEYLGVLAEFYGNTFPDRLKPVAVTSKRMNKIWDTPKKDRTPTEQKLLDIRSRYQLAGLNMLPVGHFTNDHTVKDSFRYIGRGVKLGEADRIVCWYKLKATGNYRAVYGDLSVKDVKPADLPLQVE